MPMLRKLWILLVMLSVLVVPLAAFAQGDGDDEPLDYYTDPALEVYVPLPEGWDATRVSGGNEPILFMTNGELTMETLLAEELGDVTTILILGELPIEGAPVSDQIVAIENSADRLGATTFIGDIEELVIDDVLMTVREAEPIDPADDRALFIAVNITPFRLIVAYVRFGTAAAYESTRGTVEQIMAEARMPTTAELAAFRVPVEIADLSPDNLYLGEGFVMDYSDDFILTTDPSAAGDYLGLNDEQEFLRSDVQQVIVSLSRGSGVLGTANIAIETLVESLREDIYGAVGINIDNRGAYMITGGIIASGDVAGEDETAYEYRNIAMQLEDGSIVLMAVYDISAGGRRSLDPIMPEIYAMLASVELADVED